MPRTVFVGARVFDGTGADPAPADIAVEEGRIAAVGPSLDGDEAVDCTGRWILPGLFDCHTHVAISHVDVWRHLNTPFSYRFFEATRNLAATLRAGITTARDAIGADLGIQQAVADGLVPGPRLRISLAMLSQTGGHGDDWLPSGASAPLLPDHPGIPSSIVDCPGRDAPEGARTRPDGRQPDQGGHLRGCPLPAR
jgi:imidazolonepropionase-like amidohydrolase